MLYSTFLLTLTTSALFALGLSANFFWTDIYGQLEFVPIYVLLFAALWYFFIAVMKPFGSLSRTMRTRKAALKAALLPEFDARIEGLAAQIRAGAEASKMADLFEETVKLIERRREVCNLPELPIGSVGRRMLSLGTLLPFVPLAIKVALPEMKSLSDFIGLVLKPVGG